MPEISCLKISSPSLVEKPLKDGRSQTMRGDCHALLSFASDGPSAELRAPRAPQLHSRSNDGRRGAAVTAPVCSPHRIAR